MEKLKEAHSLSLIRELSELEKLGVVRIFEFTFELSWKVMKDYLTYQGISNLYGSRDSMREAFNINLISDGGTWMNMIQTRNLTSHTYDAKTMHQVLEVVANQYLDVFILFAERMDSIEI